MILTNPDAPLNVENVPSITTSSQIGIEWVEGEANGGQPVLDYKISYAIVSDSTYTTISPITDLFYTITGLNAGV